MSRTQIAKTVNNLISSIKAIDYQLFGRILLCPFQSSSLAFNRSAPSGSFIRLDYGKKKKKEPLLQLSITPRTIAAFRCAIMVDLVKLYSSALEDNKTSIRREGIIERRRRSVSSPIPRIQTEFPLYFPLLLYPLLVE